jgi:hypothetical protein
MISPVFFPPTATNLAESAIGESTRAASVRVVVAKPPSATDAT